jgi:hypothetical protein
MARRARSIGSGPSARSRNAQALRRRRRAQEDPQAAVIARSSTHIPGEELIPLLSAPQSGMFRAGGYLHVSDLLYKCLRKIAICEETLTPMPSESVFPSTGLTFAMGHAIGDFIVDRVAERAPDKLYGSWTCLCGASVKRGCTSEQAKADEHECATCETGFHKYKELSLFDEEYYTVGNVDLALMDEQQGLILGELKSMAANQWDQLEVPVPAHKAQILLYWWLARRLGYDLADKVVILYANKSYLRSSPYKEFVLQPSLEMSYIQDYLEDLEAWKRFKNGEGRPPRIVCPSISAPAAKKCHVCVECFNEHSD